MASIATSAVPSNDAAARPATISASARVASTSQFIANGPDFSTMLAQTNAASARPPTKTDPQAKPQVPVKQATVKQAAVNKAGTMPKIADPIQAPPKTAATPAGSQPTKAASSKDRKGLGFVRLAIR